jgi:hypothetical protein
MVQSALPGQAPSKPALWSARILAAITVLFLAFDAFGKFVRPQPVVDAFAKLGMPISLAPAIGSLLAVIVVLYLIPKTRILGGILLTGYLGGAVAVQLRSGSPTFETLFPVIMGVLAWAPLYLVDERLRALIPLRQD